MSPNVLLITADQWRGDCLGIAGHPVVRTPNLDRLAGEGTWFARHYAQAAPCSPSRASLYTGLYQMNHRVVRNGTPLDARHDNLALAMRRLGYRPTLFGFTDAAVDPRTVPADSPWLRTYEGILPGFDVGVYLPENAAAWLDWLRQRGVEVPDDFRDLYLPRKDSQGRPTTEPPRYGPDETETAFMTGRFLDWLGERPAGEPWFAHVSFLRPHPPFVVPEGFLDRLAAGAPPRFRRAGSPEAERKQHPLLGYWQDRTRAVSFVAGGGFDRVSDWNDTDFETIRRVYWAMIAEVDAQVGRLLAGLAAAGSGANTVVIFTSDHGEMLGDHWTLGKFGYFDQSFHVPLIVRDPRRKATGWVEAFTEAVDIFPTILDLVGGRSPGHVDGRPLTPFLDGAGSAGWRDSVHWEYDFREVATGEAEAALGLDLDSCSLVVHRDERFKYVHFAGLPPLLFDLSLDPDELSDRSACPAYAAARLACAEKLLTWRARHLDRTLTGIELTPSGPVDRRV